MPISLIKILKEKCHIALRADCLLCSDDLSGQNKLIDNDGAIHQEVQPDICNQCSKQLKRNLHCCSHCALPLIALETSDLSFAVCGACQVDQPSWTKAVGVFQYAYPIDRLLIGLKYKGRLDYTKTLAGYLAQDLALVYDFDQLEKNTDDLSQNIPDVIVPVPLHPLREFQRGFNQAECIAEEISKIFKIPMNINLVRRKRHTPRQSLLSQKQRQKNLRNAFKVNHKIQIPSYVALVDDVMTTGSTAEVICNDLLKAGVKRVDVWCVARAE